MLKKLFGIPSVIRVDIPALSDLLAFLREERKIEQDQAALDAQTNSLKAANDKLAAAENGEQK